MLTLEQIQNLIDTKPHKKELDRARVHQDRLKFHTDTEILVNELSPYRDIFLAWICTNEPELLPKDKTERFRQLMTCPLPTVQLTQAINVALSRVFEGQDSFFRYDFQDSNKEADWEEFRDDEFWKSSGMEAMISAIDSVWVVDLPSESKEKPEPKNMLIDITNVIDISCKKNGECFYVIFSIGDKLFVYDDVSISVYDYKDKQKISEGNLLSQFTHELGYCPARMFWSDYLSSKNYINHKAPLTNVLSELDWLLVHKVFKKYMDIANSFPILVKYQSDQSYTDLTPEDNRGRSQKEQKTSAGKFIGPGTSLEVPIPLEGQPDLMANPVQWISPDVNTLQFHVTEDQRLTDYIYQTSVGIDGEQKNDQAKNEKQVMASFESQSIILRRIAQNFEKIQTFAEETIIQLRYGEEIEVSIDYGSKFFLKTAEGLMTEKEAMAGDDVMVDAVSKEMIETKFRNDSAGKTRANVINDLDPVPGKSIDEVINIYKEGGIDDYAFWLKNTLMACVRRFEREQIPISQFVKDQDYAERIVKIQEEFRKYFEEIDKPEPADTPIAATTASPVVSTEPTTLVEQTINPVKRKRVKSIN
jgi:hypothetical protein